MDDEEEIYLTIECLQNKFYGFPEYKIKQIMNLLEMNIPYFKIEYKFPFVLIKIYSSDEKILDKSVNITYTEILNLFNKLNEDYKEFLSSYFMFNNSFFFVAQFDEEIITFKNGFNDSIFLLKSLSSNKNHIICHIEKTAQIDKHCILKILYKIKDLIEEFYFSFLQEKYYFFLK